MWDDLGKDIESGKVKVVTDMHSNQPKRERTMYLSVEELWAVIQRLSPYLGCVSAGHMVYIVGSVLTRADYRDVDLRVILPDSEYERVFVSTRNGVDGMAQGMHDQFRMLIQTAISAMLRQTTGLQIDFQVQSQTEANQWEGKRNPATFAPIYQP